MQVNKGTLGGTGIITGAVTVGTGHSSGAILLPGKSATALGILTINNALTFNSRSTYKCVLNRQYRQSVRRLPLIGVTINSGVSFTFVDTGTGTLTVGTVFTVINNTSAHPISGAFSNLSDGSVFTSNGNNFQVSYEGGSGNDLTLTVPMTLISHPIDLELARTLDLGPLRSSRPPAADKTARYKKESICD